MTDTYDDDWYSNEAATFGDRLAAAREAQGLTQKELARRLGVASKTVHAWEHDAREPRANKLQMLAGVLNVSIAWLLTGEGPGVVISPDNAAEMAELMEEVRGLRNEMMQAAERLGAIEARLRRKVAAE